MQYVQGTFTLSKTPAPDLSERAGSPRERLRNLFTISPILEKGKMEVNPSEECDTHPCQVNISARA